MNIYVWYLFKTFTWFRSGIPVLSLVVEPPPPPWDMVQWSWSGYTSSTGWLSRSTFEVPPGHGTVDTVLLMVVLTTYSMFRSVTTYSICDTSPLGVRSPWEVPLRCTGVLSLVSRGTVPPLGHGTVDTVLLLVVLTTCSICDTCPSGFGCRGRCYLGALILSIYSP